MICSLVSPLQIMCICSVRTLSKSALLLTILLEIANAYMAARMEANRIAAEEYAKDSYLYGTAK